jgi:hypothetical protein
MKSTQNLKISIKPGKIGLVGFLGSDKIAYNILLRLIEPLCGTISSTFK